MIANLREDEQHQHVLGHGWIANTAKVDKTVFVGPWTCVYGKAELSGKVKVLDFAQVSGTAKLSGDVIVYGNAWVDKGTYSGKERIHSNAKVQSKQERLRPAEG